MQVLKSEFERISKKYKKQELYLENFSPEQIHHQIEDICNVVLHKCEEIIDHLYPHYNKIDKVDEEKICEYNTKKGDEKEACFEQDPDTCSESNVFVTSSVSEEADESLMGSEDFNVSDTGMSQMLAEDALKLLDSRARKNPNLYVSDESDSEEERNTFVE